MNDKSKAILSINPNAQFTTTNGVIEWLDGTVEISDADIQAKIVELNTAETNAITEKENLKASAKAKLIAGEALTQEEADTIVL
tara:strand:- start:107 stop:358 length:252 start_codon:yes stop_codon:yes gene_type:complete